MNTEKLIAKKVKHNFNQKLKQVLFDVESLKEHFDGLLIHESDILYLEEDDVIYGYVKVGDVSFDNAVPKEVVEEVETQELEIEVEPIEVDETPNLSVDADFPTYEKDNSDLEVLEPKIESEATAETFDETITVDAEEVFVGISDEPSQFTKEPITEVAETIVEPQIVKADYVFASMPSEEIIPAKVVKTKADKK
jgi:hypothetical protein